MKFICDVCGNEGETGGQLCPFCGCKIEKELLSSSREFVHKTVNLEAGRPVVEVALNRMTETLEDANRNRVNVLTLIHGYGSSGKGGAIRSECRKMLDYLKTRGRISNYILGEDFNKRSTVVKSLLRRYPRLGTDKHFNRANRGITLVILSASLLMLPVLISTLLFKATLLS